MPTFGKLFALTALFVAASTLAPARPFHHHPRVFVPAYGYQVPGAAVSAATERAQREPGVTSELAPDSKQTATGGPSGCVPGFEGGQ